MAEIEESAASRLLRRWYSEPTLTVLPPASAEMLRQFERRYGVVFPREVREYYKSANGFGPPNDQDHNGFSFWPLERMVPVAEYEKGVFSFAGAEQCFLFADYLGWSWAYAFRLTAEGTPAPVCIVGTADKRPLWISESFTEFVELYISDAPRLYAGGGALDP